VLHLATVHARDVCPHRVHPPHHAEYAGRRLRTADHILSSQRGCSSDPAFHVRGRSVQHFSKSRSRRDSGCIPPRSVLIPTSNERDAHSAEAGDSRTMATGRTSCHRALRDTRADDLAAGNTRDSLRCHGGAARTPCCRPGGERNPVSALRYVVRGEPTAYPDQERPTIEPAKETSWKERPTAADFPRRLVRAATSQVAYQIPMRALASFPSAARVL
jgi:hypothetical protein